jgi:exodeoxyribonuclease V beta subunit
MSLPRTPAATNFSFTEHPLPVGTVVDASAGTGKTYAVAAHVTLALAKDPGLAIGQILITTFTRNAAAELRDRVRRRLVATAALLRGAASATPDELDAYLLAGGAGDVKAAAGRLERAAAEFDTATIATIHGVCSRVLTCAGFTADTAADGDVRERVIDEVVNDEIVKESVAGRTWDEEPMRRLVDAAVRDPFMQPWIEPGGDADVRAEAEAAAAVVARCVGRVHAALRAQPGYDDLLRLAWEVVSGAGGAAVVQQLTDRFRLAVVDEAQDNDPLQWKLFRALFPGTDGRRLITVGDPKQAIYGFRGADVGAYVEFTAAAERRTLTTNRRSDGPLVEALNAVMEGATFHDDVVVYTPVAAAPGREASRIVGQPPLEIIDLGETGNAPALVLPVTSKVAALLDTRTTRLTTETGSRPLGPGDVCVLVRSNWVGGLIAAEFARRGIRAVTTGTSSVMKGWIAADVRALLAAMDRPSRPGLVRRAAATRFFGAHSLRDAGSLSEEAIVPVQDAIARLAGLVRSRGIAAAATAIASTREMMAALTAGTEGERHLADFAHVMELLHEHGPGTGCPPGALLEVFDGLVALPENAELVSRRVESDDDAVRIMTVHAAKGLEFPCVVVADLWKAEGKRDAPGVFHAGGARVVDIAHAWGEVSPTAATETARLAREEQKRLLYVALTRARHHLCVVMPRGDAESVLAEVLRHRDTVPIVPVERLPAPPSVVRSAGRSPAAAVGVAPLPADGVRQTMWRTSFSGITARRQRQQVDEHARPGTGFDEGDVGAGADAEAGPGVTESAEAFVPPDLPAGTAFGSVVHEIFERIDTSQPLEEEVTRVVAATATSRLFAGRHAALAEMIVRGLRTPFGGPLGTTCLADIAPENRLTELEFDMALAGVAAGVLASDVGRVLAEELPADDPLHGYARDLVDRSFDLPLAGLITGSIDAVVRLPGSTPEAQRLVIADYKTNKLHTADMSDPGAAYAPGRLAAAMAAHHYPLQAIVYGTAVYRMLRWRLKREDPSDCLAGVVYAFIRGTRGADAPADAAGRRHGMFVWQPPRALWSRMSRLFAGERP